VPVKPAFRRAFAKRRCILPADGYYEWKDKKPFYIFRTDGGGLAMAGLYELWRNPELPEDDENAFLWTAAVITTAATDDVGQIHDRMPMVIEPDLWADWLDPGNTEVSQLQAAMVPAMKGAMTSYPVSTDVNFVRNNGPELIRPLPTGGEFLEG
jgi:putative SOS response-associated peptidase YedK